MAWKIFILERKRSAEMKDKLKALLKLFKKKNKSLRVASVEMLLKKGFSAENLAREFVRINEEVWREITNEKYIWTLKKVISQFAICPHLIYCVFEDEEIVGTLSSICLTENDLKRNKSWLEKTADGFLTTHKEDGNIGFGVDLSVTRKASKKASDRLVLTAILISGIGKGIKSIYLGARIPSFHKHSTMNVEEYVYGKKKNGKPLDPELYFYLKNGFEIVEIIPEYMDDPDSLNYGVLLRWNNPLYKITITFPFLKAIIRLVGKALFIRTPTNLISH